MKSKNRFSKYIRFMIYLAVVILINLAGQTLFFRVDLTQNGAYSISDVSKQVVATLSEPLTIKVFFTKNLPAPHNATEQYLRDLLAEYALSGNRHFNYRFYNVSAEGDDASTEENRTAAENYGIYPVQIQVVEQDEVKFQRAYMGLVLIHGDIVERIDTITGAEGLEYKLTTAIQKLNNKVSALLSLEDRIRVSLYLSSSIKTVASFMGLEQLGNLPVHIEGMINKLNAKTYGKLEYRYVDPEDRQLEELTSRYQIMTLNWPELENGRIAAGRGLIGLVIEHGKDRAELPLLSVIKLPIIGTQYQLTDLPKLEEMIVDAVDSLINIHQKVGYLASHRTLPLQDPGMNPFDRSEGDMAAFSNLVSQTYSLEEVDLKEDTPEGLRCLVIAQPTETFTDYELYQLDQMLMRGTNLAIFTDAFRETPPSGEPVYGGQDPTYSPLETGLEKLLAHYGVRIAPAYVLDESCYRQQLSPRMGGGERMIYFAPIIKSEHIDHTLPFMKNIRGLITMKVSPLELDENRIQETGIRAVELLRSSDRSWQMKNRINFNHALVQPPQDEEAMRSMLLACLLEGSFPSYFAGKPIPEKKAAQADALEDSNIPPAGQPDRSKADLSGIQGEGMFRAQSRPGRIFIMGSSESLKNNLIDEDGQSPNAMFILNVLDALNDREQIAVMRSKIQRFNPLADVGAAKKTLVKMLNVVGLPVMAALFGVLVWMRRISRKKRIQMMFQRH